MYVCMYVRRSFVIGWPPQVELTGQMQRNLVWWYWIEKLQPIATPLHEVVLGLLAGFFPMLLFTPNKMDTHTEPLTTFMDLHLQDGDHACYFTSLWVF